MNDENISIIRTVSALKRIILFGLKELIKKFKLDRNDIESTINYNSDYQIAKIDLKKEIGKWKLWFKEWETYYYDWKLEIHKTIRIIMLFCFFIFSIYCFFIFIISNDYNKEIPSEILEVPTKLVDYSGFGKCIKIPQKNISLGYICNKKGCWKLSHIQHVLHVLDIGLECNFPGMINLHFCFLGYVEQNLFKWVYNPWMETSGNFGYSEVEESLTYNTKMVRTRTRPNYIILHGNDKNGNEIIYNSLDEIVGHCIQHSIHMLEGVFE